MTDNLFTPMTGWPPLAIVGGGHNFAIIGEKLHFMLVYIKPLQ